MQEKNPEEKKFKLFKFTRRRIAVLLITVLIAGGYYWYTQSRKKNGFDVSEVKRGEVVEELILTGEMKAVNYAELSFETSGKLIYVGVKEGEEVKKGALLGKLDTTTLNAAYQTALNNLRAYNATVENVHDQVKDHSGDETYAQKDTRTAAEVAKDNAYEAVIAAERNLKGASIYAPFNGIVSFVANPFAGEFVLYSQKQFEVIDPTTIYFDVSADQTEVVELKEGMKARITLDAYDEDVITGEIESIGYAPDSTEVGVVYKVKVKLDDNMNAVDFRVGMTGDASFVMDKAEDVLYVPSGFIKSDKDGKYLLIDHGADKVYIELGLEGEEMTQVKGDISEGTPIYD